MNQVPGQPNPNNIATLIGIEFLEITNEYITARMPVDDRTKQPFGRLHGGASVVLAESIGSTAAFMLIKDPSKQTAVGIEINANHLKAATSGWVYGRCTPIHKGRKTQVWDIRITNEAGDIVCISRFTSMIIDI
jgi:1,4-dihydroxy-2-naphthoyl-CoA hydrolase